MPDDCRALISAMASGRDWIWINGNHDPDGVDRSAGNGRPTVWRFRGSPSAMNRRRAQHGEIAGHLHPAATVRRREKSVRRPCFATDGERLIMPSFGVMTGGLDLGHKAFRGLFDQQKLVAHMMSREKIYAVAYAHLKG